MFTVSGKSFHAAVTAVTRVAKADRRATQLEMSGVRVRISGDVVTVSARNWDGVATATCVGDASGANIDVMVGRALLAAIPKTGIVTVTLSDNGRFLIVSGVSLPTADADTFDAWVQFTSRPIAEVTGSAVMSGAEFAQLARVTLSAGKDDTLPMLLGVFIESGDRSVTFTATDRYRLGHAWATGDVSISGEFAVIVPAPVIGHAAKLFAKSATVTLAVSGRVIELTADGYSITWDLFDGEFPKYRALLPTDYVNTVTVDPGALAPIVKHVASVCDRMQPVRLDVAALTLSAGSGDEATATASLAAVASVTGDTDNMTFGLNPTYLLDALKASKASTLITYGSQVTRPIVFTPDNDSILTLLMPVRIGS